jgi:hypothetical protein
VNRSNGRRYELVSHRASDAVISLLADNGIDVYSTNDGCKEGQAVREGCAKKQVHAPEHQDAV